MAFFVLSVYTSHMIKQRLSIQKKLAKKKAKRPDITQDVFEFLDKDRLRWHSEAFQQEKRAMRAERQRDDLLPYAIDNGIVDY